MDQYDKERRVLYDIISAVPFYQNRTMISIWVSISLTYKPEFQEY